MAYARFIPAMTRHYTKTYTCPLSRAHLSLSCASFGPRPLSLSRHSRSQAFGDVAGLLGKKPSEALRFRFFRGSKQDLLTAVGREDYVPTVALVKVYICVCVSVCVCV